MHINSAGSLRWVSLVVALCMLFLGALDVHAGDIVVERGCSLSDAIIAANENRDKGGCKAGLGHSDTIILTQHESRSRALPAITSDITLEGSGRQVEFGDHPAFVVDDARLVLKNLHLRFRGGRSGRVLEITDGVLTLANTIFHDCSGDMHAEDSTIQLLGTSNICGHGLDIINAWFGIVPPTPSTCEGLSGATVTSPLGLSSGVQCQQINAAGIGIQSVIDAGFIDAVDVWGYLGQRVDLCFPQVGALIFLDAATSPRSVTSLASYGSGGSTCATLDRPGTIVLVPGQPSGAASPAVVSAPASVSAPAVNEASVEGCPIQTTGHLKLRAQPTLDGEVLGFVVRGSTLGVISRTTYWFQVNSQRQTGWIGGLYVNNIGNC